MYPNLQVHDGRMTGKPHNEPREAVPLVYGISDYTPFVSLSH